MSVPDRRNTGRRHIRVVKVWDGAELHSGRSVDHPASTARALCHTDTAAISKVTRFRMLQNSAKNIGLVMTHCTYDAKSMCTPRVRKNHPDGHNGIPPRRFRDTHLQSVHRSRPAKYRS